MPIEFRCSQCGKMLRTGDDTAGKQAKCPSCGSIQAIPSGQPAAPAPGAFSPLGTPPAGNPFADQLSAGSPFGNLPPAVETMNPYQSPGAQLTQEPYVERGTRYRPTEINVGDVLSRSWAVFKATYWNCVGVLVVCGVVNWGAQMVEQFVLMGLSLARPNRFVFAAAAVLLAVLLGAFQIWISIGQTLFLLKLARRGEGDYGAIFAGGPYFVRVVLMYLVVALFGCAVALVPAMAAFAVYAATHEAGAAVGTFVIIVLIPSLYFSLALAPCLCLVIDQNLGPIEALRASLEITKGNKLAIFATGIVAGLFGLVGIFGCIIGILFTMPFVPLAMTVVYFAMTGQATVESTLAWGSGREPAKVPPSMMR